MKRIGYYIIGLFILTSLSCKNENENIVKDSQKNKKKTHIVIKSEVTVNLSNDINERLKINKNYFQLFTSFSKKEYSTEELIDIVKQDLNFVKDIRQSPKVKRIDTATVMSRLLLTETNLKKMQFLLHKNALEKDTIEKTLKAILNNMNSTIKQIKIYHNNIDEFSDILAIDSIQEARHDSLQKTTQKNFKGIDLNIKHHLKSHK